MQIHELEFYKETAEKNYKWDESKRSRVRSFVSHSKTVIHPTASKRLNNHGQFCCQFTINVMNIHIFPEAFYVGLFYACSLICYKYDANVQLYTTFLTILIGKMFCLTELSTKIH